MGIPISRVHRTGPVYEGKKLKEAPAHLASVARTALGQGNVYLLAEPSELPQVRTSPPIYATGLDSTVLATTAWSGVSFSSGYRVQGFSHFLPALYDDKRNKAAVDLIVAGIWCYAIDGNRIYLLPMPEVHCDASGRVHCDDGPAVIWPEGHREYWLQGIRVDAEAYESDEKLANLAITHPNMEVRRVLVEKYGLERLMKEKGKPISEDETGKLWLITGRSDVKMVQVKNSTPEPDGTYREYFLRVPPTTSTAKEGVAWTFGMKAEEYHPEVQT